MNSNPLLLLGLIQTLVTLSCSWQVEGLRGHGVGTFQKLLQVLIPSKILFNNLVTQTVIFKIKLTVVD